MKQITIRKSKLFLLLGLHTVLLGVMFFGVVDRAYAATCTTNTSGLWMDPIWDCDEVITFPADGDDAVINNGHTVTLANMTGVNNLTIDGALVLQADLTLNGNWTNNGSFDPGTVDVIVNGNAPLGLNGNTTFYNLSINNPTSVTTTNQITVTNLLGVNNTDFINYAPMDLAEVVITGDWSPAADVTVSGDWTDNGFFQPGGRAVTFDGVGADQMITGTGGLAFNDLIIANTGITDTVTIGELIEVSGTVSIDNDGHLDIQSDNINFDPAGVIINNGWLQITKLVDGSFGVDTKHFPGTGSGLGDYRGVEITTSDNLGDVTVVVQGNADTCTNQSSNYANRCFTVSPANATGVSATLKLFALLTELNGIDANNLTVYHWDPGWNELANISTGTEAPNYAYAQGDADTFSIFILGEQGQIPTAIGLQSLSAKSPGNSTIWLLGLTVLSVTMASWMLIRRKVRENL